MMDNLRHEAVKAIMTKFFHYTVTTITWYTNYAERNGAPAEYIKELREKLKEFKDMLDNDKHS